MKSRFFVGAIGLSCLIIGFLLAGILFTPFSTTAQPDTPELSRKELIMLIALSPEDGLRLRGVNLAGADLHLLDFSGADLTLSNLSGANAYKTLFQNAVMAHADLTGANQNLATLQGATLGCVDI